MLLLLLSEHKRKSFPFNAVASSLEITDQGRDWYSWW